MMKLLATLILADDGKSISPTKLAAATFHFSLFATVMFITATKREFVIDMWTLYSAVALGHSVADNVITSVTSIKNRQIDVQQGPSK